MERSTSAATGLKNFRKWSTVANSGTQIGPFVPMKLPYDLAPAENGHTIALMKALHPTLGIVLDLQNQDSVYSAANTGVVRQRVTHESKVIPSVHTVARFCDAADAWLRQHPDTLVGVHCHYGFNRTGFLLVSYLVEREKWDVDVAIAAFAESRPPGIKHQNFIDELRQRYATTPEKPNSSEARTATTAPSPVKSLDAASSAVRLPQESARDLQSSTNTWWRKWPWARENWAAILVASMSMAIAARILLPRVASGFPPSPIRAPV